MNGHDGRIAVLSPPREPSQLLPDGPMHILKLRALHLAHPNMHVDDPHHFLGVLGVGDVHAVRQFQGCLERQGQTIVRQDVKRQRPLSRHLTRFQLHRRLHRPRQNSHFKLDEGLVQGRHHTRHHLGRDHRTHARRNPRRPQQHRELLRSLPSKRRQQTALLSAILGHHHGGGRSGRARTRLHADARISLPPRAHIFLAILTRTTPVALVPGQPRPEIQPVVLWGATPTGPVPRAPSMLTPLALPHEFPLHTREKRLLPARSNLRVSSIPTPTPALPDASTRRGLHRTFGRRASLSQFSLHTTKTNLGPQGAHHSTSDGKENKDRDRRIETIRDGETCSSDHLRTTRHQRWPVRTPGTVCIRQTPAQRSSQLLHSNACWKFGSDV
mmetsp:Transcript_2789/g.8352  ORF Transcript_2789/g.8352 Transcript_2789/m.8352 type:complete len:385 (-) Transcript_2789:108-1262(-)